MNHGRPRIMATLHWSWCMRVWWKRQSRVRFYLNIDTRLINMQPFVTFTFRCYPPKLSRAVPIKHLKAKNFLYYCPMMTVKSYPMRWT